MSVQLQRALLVVLFLPSTCTALFSQNISVANSAQNQERSSDQMPGMNQGNAEKDKRDSVRSMESMHHEGMQMGEQPTTFIGAIEQHATSGTSAEPNSTPMQMLMTMKGNWMLMLHGVAFFNVLQQTGPRGVDKVFSTNWIMPMAQRRLGPGTVTLRTMLSSEPATVTQRYYHRRSVPNSTKARIAAAA